MTDNEIIKALECCKTLNCVKCGRIEDFKNASACLEKMIAEALDLINRQKADIERLNIRNKTLIDITKNYDWKFARAKSEAIKEFAERLKCGVPQETGVIRCADVDNLVKEMTEVNKE